MKRIKKFKFGNDDDYKYNSLVNGIDVRVL